MYHRLVNEDEPDDHSQNDLNAYELKNRNKERKSGDASVDNELNRIDFIYHTIKSNETLQGIALRYGCTVSKLRLYNHLMNDHEFHALSVLKIPVIKNSVLIETFPGQKPISTPQFVDNLIDLADINNSSTNAKTQVINIGISNYLTNNGSENYHKFLNNLDEDLKEIRKSTEFKIEASDATHPRAESELFFDKGHSQANNANNNTKSAFTSCDGSDFGIHWRYLIAVLIIICLLVPSYVFFFLEHHNATNSHHPH